MYQQSQHLTHDCTITITNIGTDVTGVAGKMPRHKYYFPPGPRCYFATSTISTLLSYTKMVKKNAAITSFRSILSPKIHRHAFVVRALGPGRCWKSFPRCRVSWVGKHSSHFPPPDALSVTMIFSVFGFLTRCDASPLLIINSRHL